MKPETYLNNAHARVKESLTKVMLAMDALDIQIIERPTAGHICFRVVQVMEQVSGLMVGLCEEYQTANAHLPYRN